MKKYTITSSSNKTYRLFQSLLVAKGVNEHEQALVFGAKHSQDIIKNYRDNCLGVILASGMTPPPTGIADVTFYELNSELFGSLDVFKTHSPILLIKPPDIFEWKEPFPDLGMSVVLPLQDPTNMGACLRVAAAFGVTDIILTPTSCNPFIPRSMRSAAANIFSMKYHFVPNINKIKQSSMDIFALSLNGESIEQIKFPKHFILVLGTEGPGLPGDLNDAKLVKIPIEPSVESLNVGSALSICLYKWKQSFI